MTKIATINLDIDVEVGLGYVLRISQLIGELEQLPGISVKSTFTVNGTEMSTADLVELTRGETYEPRG